MLFEIRGVICDSQFILAVGPLREETADGRTHFIKMQDDVAMAAIDFDRICYDTVYLTAEEAAPVMEYFKVRVKRDSMPARLTKIVKALERELSTLAKLQLSEREAAAKIMANQTDAEWTPQAKTRADQIDKRSAAIRTAINALNTAAAIR
jgi:hypothetical protein